MTDTSKIPEEAKRFIRAHYIELGPRECAVRTGVAYGTLKRWANRNGLRMFMRKGLQVSANMSVADRELELLNRRAWR